MRDEADFVITNPPFSLFRQFMTWVVGGGRKFSVIGHGNAITYNEVFPHIMDNELWKGATANTTDMVFGVPEGAKVSDAATSRSGRTRRCVTRTEAHCFVPQPSPAAGSTRIGSRRPRFGAAGSSEPTVMARRGRYGSPKPGR